MIHRLIYKWAKGFHQIIGEWEGVAPVVVEYAQRGCQARGNQCTCRCCPKYALSIVEQGIDAGLVSVSDEVFAEEFRELNACGNTLSVVSVSALYIGIVWFEYVAFAMYFLQ